MPGGLGPAILGAVVGDAEALVGRRLRPPSFNSFSGVFHVKRKIVLHHDVLHVLAQLRQLEPVRLEMGNVPGHARVGSMYVQVYDLDDLLVALNDCCYKFTREAD